MGLSNWVFDCHNIADNTGWELLEIKDGGYLPIFDFSEFKIPLLLSNAFRWLFYLVSKNFKKGWCLIFVFKKKSVDFTLSMPVTRKQIFVTNTIGGIAILVMMIIMNVLLMLLF